MKLRVLTDGEVARFVRTCDSHGVVKGFIQEHQRRGGSVGSETRFAMTQRGWSQRTPLDDILERMQ